SARCPGPPGGSTGSRYPPAARGRPPPGGCAAPDPLGRPADRAGRRGQVPEGPALLGGGSPTRGPGGFRPRLRAAWLRPWRAPLDSVRPRLRRGAHDEARVLPGSIADPGRPYEIAYYAGFAAGGGPNWRRV